MGIDAGIKAPAGSAPPGIVAGSGVEVKVVDSIGEPSPAYVYLFRQTGNLDPSAGRRYVDYRFNLLSGDYKSTYKLGAGPNPEDSTVTTDFYRHRFTDRWIDDDAGDHRPSRPAGADILDRHKNLFAPGNCVRSENTFSNGEGAFIVNKNGPVRAIRSYIGANSGTYTHREHSSIERRQDMTTFLRVHAIPGVMDFFDYSAGRDGHDLPQRVRQPRRDGRRRARHPRPRSDAWESIDGPQGSLGIVHSFNTDIAPRLDLLLPRQAEPGRRRGDPVHGRRLVLRCERHPGHRIAAQHRPHVGSGQPPGGHTEPVLRLTRQGRGRAAQGPGGQPAADHAGNWP